MPVCKGLIFDMDGLMIDTEPVYRSAWRSACSALGYSLSDELFESLIGRSERDSEAIVMNAFGSDFPVRRFRETYNEKTDALIARTAIPLMEGVTELLEFVDMHHLPRVVATSTKRSRALQLLESTGLQRWFSSVVTGDQVAKGKPDPEIFTTAAAAIGIRPAQCVVLEDSEPGILAAHSAGAIPIMVPGLKKPEDAVVRLAFGVYSSLLEVKDVLKGMIGP